MPTSTGHTPAGEVLCSHPPTAKPVLLDSNPVVTYQIDALLRHRLPPVGAP
jgi:hypothetical protein